VVLAVLGAVVFRLPPARAAFVWINDAVLAVLTAGNAGARFLFGPLALNAGARTAAGEPSVGFVLAAQVLPAVVFFSALLALLYHLGWIQPLVRLLARGFRRGMGLSGAEALAGAANIFVGVEAAVTVRPYLERMTRSELLTVLACGMSTVASTTLAIYVAFLRDVLPQIAGHLISASILSIPAAALMAKLLLPETGSPETLGALPPAGPGASEPNAMAALMTGAWDGLRLAAGIATLLVAVLGLAAILDLALGALPGTLDSGTVLGWIFLPLAWLLGIPSGEVHHAARLLGERAVLTEVVAYRHLADLAAAAALSERTIVILSYALCGFTHVASVGIFVGGTAALAPSRRGDLAGLAGRAFVASTLATLLTGAVAGIFCGDEPANGQRQRKSASAATNDTTPQTATNPSSPATAPRDAPSTSTARSASLTAVSGSAWTNGWTASGNRLVEKNVPDSSHIGSMTTFIRPETPSIVWTRLATRRPSPAKVAPPSPATAATAIHEPRIGTSNAQRANASRAITSRTRKTILPAICASR
jgi:CNT family concentrative nucleoside transporter